MLHHTFFIVSKGKEKATVMNRFTKEAFTRKINKKGEIVINYEKYSLEDMKTLTENMMKLKVLESQGCSSISDSEDFFPTELKHDSSELLFYLDEYGFVNVNGQMYLRDNADEAPLVTKPVMKGVISTAGEVFLGDYPSSLEDDLLKEEYMVAGKKIKFNTVDEVITWVKEVVEVEFDGFPSPVEFTVTASKHSPTRLNFGIANQQGRYKDVTYGLTLLRTSVMSTQEPFSLYSLGRIV